MSMKKPAAIAAAVILLVLLAGGGWYVSTSLTPAAPRAQSQADPQGVPGGDRPSATVPQAEARPKLKVGVVVSLHSAAEIFNGGPRGYRVQTRIAPDLDAPDIELIPIIEAGSETDADLNAQLLQFFPGSKPIPDSDAAGLRSVAVIVAAEVWAPTPQLVANLDAAVNDGVAFFNDGISDPEGYNSADHHARNLAGLMESASFGSAQSPVPCTCLENHPILGNLWGFPDISLRPLGVMGKLPPDAKPLIKVSNPGDVAGATEQQNFYPLYISHDGKGKVVACTFAPYKGVPEPLAAEGRPKFFLRCVRWLAGRPVE